MAAATDPVWQQAQLVRCRHLLDQARTLREQGSWEEAELVVEDIRAHRDCIKKFAERVLKAGVVQPEELAAIDASARSAIEDAVHAARLAPLPSAEDLLTDVYVSY